MNIRTRKAIQDYNKTIASLRNLHKLALKANHPDMFSNSFCLLDDHPAAKAAFRKAMKAMYMEYKGTNMFYKAALLRAALGIDSAWVSPSVWS